MQIIDISLRQGKTRWQQLVARATAGADPEAIRRDPLTLRVFGRALSPREAVAEILKNIQRQGDRALLHYIRVLDGCAFRNPRDLIIPSAIRQKARAQVPKTLRLALAETVAHIRAFHQSQHTAKRALVTRPGVKVTELRKPLERVGIYVPGASAPLIASVLMNAIPARVAGVKEIFMATPPKPSGEILPAMIYAAELAGVDTIYRMGGAPAIAAMAYGTATIQRVDKIVGPANVFGNEAKRQVVGQVGIDNLAGPSEIMIIADHSADPETLAWDLLAQGEHGSGAMAVLLTSVSGLAERVCRAAKAIVGKQPDLIFARQAAIVVKVKNLAQAIQLANEYAPEHLSLQVRNARSLLHSLRQAGAIFLGADTAQAMGDYTAGPNHVLPTAQTARWSSPLSVRDFEHYTSVVEYSGAGMRREGAAAMAVAEAEGLIAHAQSIRQRIKKPRS